MYGMEIAPAFRGAAYIDDAQMVDADTGVALPWDLSDTLTWRLFPIGRRGSFLPGYGYGCGWDYGFAAHYGAIANHAAIITLTVGAGLVLGSVGVVQWLLPAAATFLLRSPEYRMTLDLDRYGEVVRILDTILSVEA